MTDLKSRLDKLKEYSSQTEIDRINRRIYNLELDNEFLKSISQETIIYIHVKLHAAASYKKPFAPIEDVKKYHDIITKFLRKHVPTDSLDD